jgi:hypothetical protein
MKGKGRIITISILAFVILITAMLFFLNNNPDSYETQNIVSQHRKINSEINDKDSGKKIPLTEEVLPFFLEREKPVLVLRLKEIYCASCVEAEIENVARIKDVFKDDFYLLVSQSSSRFIKRLFLQHQTELPFIEIPFNLLSELYFEQFETPYYFLLHNDMHISNIFVPAKELPMLTVEYFENVKKITSGRLKK